MPAKSLRFIDYPLNSKSLNIFRVSYDDEHYIIDLPLKFELSISLNLKDLEFK